MAKQKLSIWPALTAVAIVLLIIYIVHRSENSPITKLTQWISSVHEGFSVPPVLSTPQCPIGYKFFNDARGESFCCAGDINRYSHKCLAKAENGLCGMKPDSDDPRNPGKKLSWCASLIKSGAAAAQKANCPGALKYYGRVGKCCATGTDLDGLDCLKEDNADMKKYCLVKGPLKPGEQLCSDIKMNEGAVCPSGLQKVNYALGGREKAKYGAPADGKVIPACFGMDAACIPDNVLDQLKKEGMYREVADPSKWLYACSGWKRKNVDRDLTVNYNTKYI